MSKETKTTTENNPPEWAEPLFRTSATDAQRLYDSGAGGHTYMGHTVAPLSERTLAGVDQLAKAGQNWDTSGTRPLFQAIGAESASDPFVNRLAGAADNVRGEQVGTGGFDAARTAANDVGGLANRLFSPISGGGTQIGTGEYYRNVYNEAQQPTAADKYLTDTASGAYLQEGNPYYRQRLDQEIQDANDRLRSMFSGAGRYGSGASVDALAENTRDMTLAGLENDWNRERGLQMQAAGMLDQSKQGAYGTQLAALTGLTGVEGQNIANRLTAAGQQIGAQSDTANLLRGLAGDVAGVEAGNADRLLSAAGLQGNLLSQAGALRGQGLDRSLQAATGMYGMDQQNFQNMLTGANATLGAGQILDQQAQQELADEVARFYALDNEDWQRLGMLQAAAAGAAGNYGIQNQTTRQPINPWGAIGALFSGKSDIRLKENIVRVGEANGVGVYEFSYAGQKDRWRGVMAQELPIGSDAVFIEDGWLAVDYAKLGFPMERVH